MKLYRHGILLLLGTFTLLFNTQAWSVDPVFNQSGVAIRGYDPVAYFTDDGPVKGDPSNAHQWMGTSWQFANKTNLKTFVDNPEKYAPQYGGYCAYAASSGYIAPTDPNAWTIHNGKLYLNYSKSIRKRWSKDKNGHIKSADKNWPGLKGS